MSVTLTDEQYGTVMCALTRIANARTTTPAGFQAKLSRIAVETIARDACDSLGWPYDAKTTNAASAA